MIAVWSGDTYSIIIAIGVVVVGVTISVGAIIASIVICINGIVVAAPWASTCITGHTPVHHRRVTIQAHRIDICARDAAVVGGDSHIITIAHATITSI